MFTDTHCHLQLISEYEVDCASILQEMKQKQIPFILDIGTKYDDLVKRISFISDVCKRDEDLEAYTNKVIHYSAGIWPDITAVRNYKEQVQLLENIVIKYREKICAIGECGIDHHWDISGVDHRNKSDFSQNVLLDEAKLFEMQIDLAKKFNLPVIVHSREGFLETISCIKNSGYNNGVIHCFAYGLEEAKQFLDLGWYIALGGAVTYTKKSVLEEKKKLINFIPDDRLLLETDAPYLAPVPFRGKTNNPLLIEHTYKYIAEVKKIEISVLCDIVYKNSLQLFNKPSYKNI